MAFEKGKSGNPGGRPRATMPDGRSLAEAAREHSPKALAVLVYALKSEKIETAMAAAQALLDRGFGRAAQSIELTGAEGGPVQTTAKLDVTGLSEQTLREIAALRAD